jgi:hypothetical protein
VVLNASQRNRRVPRLAAWSFGVGIVATIGAAMAHGLGHGLIGALVSVWPALALVGSYGLMMVISSALCRCGEGPATEAGHWGKSAAWPVRGKRQPAELDYWERKPPVGCGIG